MNRQFVLDAVGRGDPAVRGAHELGGVDHAIIRCIAGELTRNSLAWSTRNVGVDAQRRMDSLLSRHLNMDYAELRALPGSQRKRLAHYIGTAEMEERETMPGALTPSRPCRATPSERPEAFEPARRR